MSVQERFLTLYKEYETLVRDEGLDTKCVEETSDDITGGRLRMCRLFRNYFSHSNDPGFLEPTDKMFKFLESQVKTRREKNDVAKKHLKSAAATIFSEKDKCSEVLNKMTRLQLSKVPVQSTTGKWAVVSIFCVAETALAGKTKKVSEAKPLREKPLFCAPLDKVAALDADRVIICTDTGRPDGKPMGMVIL